MTELDEQRQRAREAREALVGKTVAGKYVLCALLGHGGMGAVYEAENEAIGKRVAIKFVDAEFATDEQVVKRFAREARAMSAIESAHIVTVFDAGTEDGRPYLVMELLRGEDLGQRLRRTRRVPVGEAMHVVAQVLKGLARAHAAGIVHRDLKPDNVFLAKTDTDPLFAKIVDFGISKIERPRATTSPLALTGRGTVLGTPLYMSPEQAQCATDVDGRADLYSVGAILFECLTGRPPHTGETYEQIILSICMREAPDVRAIEPSVPEDLSRFVARALARDKTERYASAERMLAALHDVAPAERARVPLDAPAHPPAAPTMLSPGVVAASASAARSSGSASAEAPLVGGGVATRVGVALLEPPPVGPAGADAPATRRRPEAAFVEASRDAASAWREAAEDRPRSPPARAPRRSAEPASGRTRAPRSTGLLVATALGATLLGVGATFGVLYATGPASRDASDGRGAPSSATNATGASGATGATNATVATGATGATETTNAQPPAASASATAASARTAAAATPGATPPPKTSTLPSLPPGGRPPGKPPTPTTAKPLDIQRDFP